PLSSQTLGPHPGRDLVGLVGDDVGVDDRTLGVDGDRKAGFDPADLGDRGDRAARAHARLDPPGGDAVHRLVRREPVEQAPVALARGVLVVGVPAHGQPAGPWPWRTRSASVSATATGSGSLAAAASARVLPPVSTMAPSRWAAAAPARSTSTRSPTTSARPWPRRSSAVRYSHASGLPTLRAVRPVAYSTAATIVPVPGHGPSGMGKVASRPAASRSAPRSPACVATRRSS